MDVGFHFEKCKPTSKMGIMNTRTALTQASYQWKRIHAENLRSPKLKENETINVVLPPKDSQNPKKTSMKVGTKVDPKVDTAGRAKIESEIAKKIGKQTAKEFVHENLVFPTRLDIVIDPYELSMSSLAKKGIHHTSYLYEEKHFNAFFVAHSAHWFKCCNEVRSEIMWSSKERYFSK